VTDTQCHDQGGTFMGDDSVCVPGLCPDPVGACCYGGTALCDITEPLCEGLAGVYMGNGSDCELVDCSTGACCMADGSCRDTVQLECGDLGGIFHGGTSCASYDCPQPYGSCCVNGLCVPNQRRDTCEAVGTWNGIDSTCDPDPCIANPCPTAVLFGADPASGTVDARAPHRVDALLPRLGLGSADEPIIVSLGVDGADASCFTLCETGVDPLLGANGFASVTPLGGGQYELVLDHAIFAGETTMLRYEGHAGEIVYIAHPANVNGDELADAEDVSVLVDALNGWVVPPYGAHSSDIDHNGTLGPADLLTTIDLLNGAGEFAGWQGTLIPPPTCP
jgi:hypothetical protein